MLTAVIRSGVSTQSGLRQFVWRLGGIALLTTVLCACSEPRPEARLEEVSEDLSDSTASLDDLNTRIAQTETLLTDLRDQRRRLRDEVRNLEQRLEARATDVAIFRAVQSSLLEDDLLRESAISVSVEENMVSLSGVVTSDEKIRRATTIAENTAGVDSVVTQIQVDDPAADH